MSARRDPAAEALEAGAGTDDVAPAPESQTETEGQTASGTETERDEVEGQTDEVDIAPPQPWGWHVVRVSGLFLAALLVWHVVVTFVLGDVGQTTAVTVSNRWHDATWRALEWVTLVLALGHGGLGLDTLLRRRPWPAGTITAARVASAAVIGLLVVAASVVVLTFR